MLVQNYGWPTGVVPKYGFGWPDGRLGGLGPPGSTTPAVIRFELRNWDQIVRSVSFDIKNGNPLEMLAL